MLLHLSPEAARTARNAIVRELDGVKPNSKAAKRAIENVRTKLAIENGIEISEAVLRQLGAELGDQDPTLGAMRLAVQQRTGLPFGQVKKNIGTGLTNAIARLQDSAKGPPTHLGELVGPRTYHAVSAQRLRGAKLLWANTNLLVDKGIATPAQAKDPAFKQALLDAFAYSVRRDEDNDAQFDVDDKKAFAADYQGGEGNWGTLGSGRAMSAGQWQVKGGGDTSLSLKSGSKIGGLDLTTGISEAILGEINHQELPMGGNRILALIATGTTSKTKEGEDVPRILAIREDPLRPSKYMIGELDRVFDPENLRAKENIGMVHNAFPGAGELDAVDKDQQVMDGARQYVLQTAEQYGTAFVKRLYHGATSPSNAQLDGGWLDYDLQTAQPGYGKINVLFSEASFGENHTVKKLVVQDFLQDVFDNTPGLEHVDMKPLLDEFDDKFQATVQREMAALTGAPRRLVDALFEDGPAQELGAVLHKIARVPLGGNRRSIHIDMDAVGEQAMPTRTNEYDIGEIVAALSRADWSSPIRLSRAIADVLPHNTLRPELAAAYAKFTKALTAIAREDGIPARGLKNLVRRSTQLRNEPMTGVFRPILRENIANAITDFAESGDAQAISDLIDHTVQSNLRTTFDEGTYKLVLSQKYDDEGNLVGKVYDARTDKVRTERLGMAVARESEAGLPATA